MKLPFNVESEETDRLVALSDGVIAIAITLLVLEISVPELPAEATVAAFSLLVSEQWHEFFGFVLSFWVIGLYWILHRRIFVHIERHERGVLYLNLLFLLMVAFIPFASSVFATYPGQFGVIFISAMLALTGISLSLLWGYASREELFEKGLMSRAVQIQSLRFLASPLVFLLSIVVALFSPTLAMVTWLLLIPINATLQSRLAESLEENAREPTVKA
ncbi:TMEM175 family protein [Haloferax sp. DFSO60]|uniref:TMEM175 family protein n=1 Tax=Haloferax sp. DFSO60 TaxID=3388652 RepID=UPI003979D039